MSDDLGCGHCGSRHCGRGLRTGVREPRDAHSSRRRQRHRQRSHGGGDGAHRGDGRLARADGTYALFADAVAGSLRSAFRPMWNTRQCGTLWVASDEEEMEEVRRKSAVYASAGIRTEILDGQDAGGRRAASCDSRWRALCWCRRMQCSIRRARPDICCAKRCAWAHGSIRRKALSAQAGEVRLDDGTELHAARIVNASGADAGALLPGLPIRKRKGHLVDHGSLSGICAASTWWNSDT